MLRNMYIQITNSIPLSQPQTHTQTHTHPIDPAHSLRSSLSFSLLQNDHPPLSKPLSHIPHLQTKYTITTKHRCPILFIATSFLRVYCYFTMLLFGVSQPPHALLGPDGLLGGSGIFLFVEKHPKHSPTVTDLLLSHLQLVLCVTCSAFEQFWTNGTAPRGEEATNALIRQKNILTTSQHTEQDENASCIVMYARFQASQLIF